jgi:hypothetical protein
MGLYCDTRVLELNWFNWLLSSATAPELDAFRDRGLLLTKVLGKVKIEAPSGVKFFPDPLHPIRSHCIASATPVYFNSYNGHAAKPVKFNSSRPRPCAMPVPGLRLVPVKAEVERLLAAGYVIEKPVIETWHSILLDVERICRGIASKLNLPSDDAKADLASDALLQVITKIRTKKLIYTPGRAPVFNLLTTTIHRIMYSILNRDNKARQNAANTAILLRVLAASSHRRPHGKRIGTVRRYGSLVACPVGS